MPQYSVRQDLVSDLVAGFTVAVMHIPQVQGSLEIVGNGLSLVARTRLTVIYG